MKVLLLQNIKGIGQMGDIKNVSDGYARNFLLPRQLAQAATPDSIKLATVLKKNKETRIAKNEEEAAKIAEQLAGITLTITETANDEGHLYGSIDAKRIAQELKNQHAITLDPDSVILDQHIKTTGEHEVEINLHKDVPAHLKVIVNSPTQ